MAYLDFVGQLHSSTKRDYIGRVNAHDKAECAEIAIRYDREYWDGERHTGYGGYKYDGHWNSVAQTLVDHYKLKPDAKILDVGCGKGFLLHEFKQILPACEVTGIDISQYAVENGKEEVRPNLHVGNAAKLPWEDNSFDFIVSITSLHNLYNYELFSALQEIERVGRGEKYIVIESYRNEREKANLLYWQLTCRSFYSPKEWEWFFEQAGYSGDYGCIYFE